MIKKQLKGIAKKLMYIVPTSFVLMFHHVEETPALPRSKCLLATERFYEIISAFPAKAYVSVQDVLKKGKRIAITFDDGLEDVYRVAYPYLKEKKIPFCIFVVTDFLDQPGYITTEQLLEMNQDPLVTIGSHGITHKNLPELSEAAQISELADSKQSLENLLGKPVKYFAYSHGQYDATTLCHVRIYENAFSVVSRGLNFLTNRRWEIPRINIDSTVNLEGRIKQIGLLVNKR